jgi:hypothetical protein
MLASLSLSEFDPLMLGYTSAVNNRQIRMSLAGFAALCRFIKSKPTCSWPALQHIERKISVNPANGPESTGFDIDHPVEEPIPNEIKPHAISLD